MEEKSYTWDHKWIEDIRKDKESQRSPDLQHLLEKAGWVPSPPSAEGCGAPFVQTVNVTVGGSQLRPPAEEGPSGHPKGIDRRLEPMLLPKRNDC